MEIDRTWTLYPLQTLLEIRSTHIDPCPTVHEDHEQLSRTVSSAESGAANSVNLMLPSSLA